MSTANSEGSAHQLIDAKAAHFFGSLNVRDKAPITGNPLHCESLLKTGWLG